MNTHRGQIQDLWGQCQGRALACAPWPQEGVPHSRTCVMMASSPLAPQA